MNRQQRDFALKLKQYIIDEPQRIWMDFFVKDVTKYRDFYRHDPKTLGELRALACDSVGCIAGTACFLATGDFYANLTLDDEHISFEERAAALLGISRYEADGLFFFHYEKLYYRDKYVVYKNKLNSLKPGTQEYASVVAAALQCCIDTNFEG